MTPGAGLDFLDICWDAYKQGDLSTCKPLGLTLNNWVGLLGVTVAAVIAYLVKSIRAVVVAVVRWLLALVIRKPTIIDPLLAKPDREVRGRDADIARIDRALEDRSDLPAVAVTGPGGYGKTTLAGEYARRRARRYRGVWLVDATSLGTARNSLARLGARLEIEVPDKAEEGID